ncbi:MAG: hypothetical protein EAZ53_06465 [Bacteroidetes bacterium]|nr:MAG: hypothetical protein EAZ53_06465 [Bacteroidota bacterium]
MTYIDITGNWENEFGSIFTVQNVDNQTGIFFGTYSSHTGATGSYYVVGVTDFMPDPTTNSQTVSFSISWRSYTSPPVPPQTGDNWVSGFAGQLQIAADGSQQIVTTYLLQKNSNPADNWGATVVATATFKRINTYPKLEELSDVVLFSLQKGILTENGATPWFASVGIGTPSQFLKLMIDTGTDNTWVTSSQCTTQACLAHDTFNAANSSTFNTLDPNPKIKSFGPWGNMTVIEGQDYFSLTQIQSSQKKEGIITSEAMNFENAINYDGPQFLELDCDGGIAIPSPFWEATPNTESLMLQLLKDGKIDYAIASFWYNSSNGVGECLFGAVDYSKFDYQTLRFFTLQEITVTGLGYLWALKLNAFMVNNVAVQAGITSFVLDTGSSIFKANQQMIDALLNAVTLNGQLPISISDPNLMANYPTITLNLCNNYYNLTPQQYFIQLSTTSWTIGIQTLDGMPQGMLLVGSVFLETVYSIFDYENSIIALANPII